MAPAVTASNNEVSRIEVLNTGMQFESNMASNDNQESICCIISNFDYNALMALDLFVIDTLEMLQNEEMIVEIRAIIEMDENQRVFFDEDDLPLLQYACDTYPVLENIYSIRWLLESVQ